MASVHVITEDTPLTYPNRLNVRSGSDVGPPRIPGGEGIPTAGLQATRTSADGPDGLAFDRAGDLFGAGFDTKTLFMISPGGRVSLPIGPDGFYPRGNGGLVTAPDGTASVAAINAAARGTLTGTKGTP
jgi:hypothetical protein